jgi:hypothetical protein
MMPTNWVKSLQLVDEYTGWTPLEFANIFYTNYNYYPTYHAVTAFSAGEILMAAIEKSQSLEPTKLAEILRTTSFPIILANASFDSNNQVKTDMLVVQIQNDLTAGLVYPQVAPNTTFTWPLPTWSMKQCWIDTNDCAGHGYCVDGGYCVCDSPYYGKTNTKSCDAYCDGVRAFDPERKIVFCKVDTVFNIGAVTISGYVEEVEHRALLRLAADLINNKTDGFFDENTTQVLLQIAEDSWECDQEAGFYGLKALDERVQNYTGSTETALDAAVLPDCSAAW